MILLSVGISALSQRPLEIWHDSGSAMHMVCVGGQVLHGACLLINGCLQCMGQCVLADTDAMVVRVPMLSAGLHCSSCASSI